MKIIKNNLKITITIIISAIIFSSFGAYAATTLASSSVSYDNSKSGGSYTNVKESIDDLYNKVNVTIPSSLSKILVADVKKDDAERNIYIERDMSSVIVMYLGTYYGNISSITSSTGTVTELTSYEKTTTEVTLLKTYKITNVKADSIIKINATGGNNPCNILLVFEGDENNIKSITYGPVVDISNYSIGVSNKTIVALIQSSGGTYTAPTLTGSGSTKLITYHSSRGYADIMFIKNSGTDSKVSMYSAANNGNWYSTAVIINFN